MAPDKSITSALCYSLDDWGPGQVLQGGLLDLSNTDPILLV